MEPAFDPVQEPQQAAFRQRVRATAIWAAIGGGLMLWFGSTTFYSRIDSPMYAAALDARMWTLRIGGGAMLAVAALCLAGWTWALLIDAVLCAGVVLMLAGVGVVFLQNGDYEGFLSIIFALVFGSAGWHSWKEFQARPRAGVSEYAPPMAASTPPPVTRTQAGAESHSIFEVMRRKRQGELAGPAEPPPRAEPTPLATDVAASAEADGPAVPQGDDEPAGGFLAALAREGERKKRRDDGAAGR